MLTPSQGPHNFSNLYGPSIIERDATFQTPSEPQEVRSNLFRGSSLSLSNGCVTKNYDIDGLAA